MAISPYQGVYPDAITRVQDAEILERNGAAETEPDVWGCQKVLQAVALFFYYALFPITYPCKLLFSHVYPFTGLIENILRLAIFSTDLNQTTGGRWLLWLVGIPIMDSQRIEKTKDNLRLIGAEIQNVRTEDGGEVEVMRLTQENFRQAVTALGGQFVMDGEREIIQGGNQRLQTALEKLGWPKVEGGFQVSEGTTLKEGKSEGVVLRLHPYAYFSYFEKKYLINHMALGKDVVFCNVRGFTQEDQPTYERKAYLDAAAAYNHVKDRWGYSPEKIWVGAKCSGVVAATYLRERYPDDDFHMVLENGFLHFKHLVEEKHAPFMSWIGMELMPILSGDEEEQDIYCDNFDNRRKLTEAAEKRDDWKSDVVVISTDTDGVVEATAGRELARLGTKVSAHCYHFVHRGEPGKEGHYDEVLIQDDALFQHYSEILTEGTRRVHSNFRQRSPREAFL